MKTRIYAAPAVGGLILQKSAFTAVCLCTHFPGKIIYSPTSLVRKVSSLDFDNCVIIVIRVSVRHFRVKRRFIIIH